MRRTIKRFLGWRVTVTIRPPVVIALLVLDAAVRAILTTAIRHAMPILDLATGLVMFGLLLLIVYCVTAGKPHRDDR